MCLCDSFQFKRHNHPIFITFLDTGFRFLSPYLPQSYFVFLIRCFNWNWLAFPVIRLLLWAPRTVTITGHLPLRNNNSHTVADSWHTRRKLALRWLTEERGSPRERKKRCAMWNITRRDHKKEGGDLFPTTDVCGGWKDHSLLEGEPVEEGDIIHNV